MKDNDLGGETLLLYATRMDGFSCSLQEMRIPSPSWTIPDLKPNQLVRCAAQLRFYDHQVDREFGLWSESRLSDQRTLEEGRSIHIHKSYFRVYDRVGGFCVFYCNRIVALKIFYFVNSCYTCLT